MKAGSYCKKQVEMSLIRVTSEDSMEIIARLESWGEKIAHCRLKSMLNIKTTCVYLLPPKLGGPGN